MRSHLIAPSREKLILSLPDEILHLENVTFLVSQWIGNISLKSSFVKTGLRRRTFRLPLRDISSNGASISIPNKLLPYFFEGEEIFIHQIGLDQLGSDFDGQIIRMIQPYHDAKKTTHHLGISFNSSPAGSCFSTD